VLYAVFSQDKVGAEALRAETRAAHLAYLERHRDKLVLGGATLSDDGAQKTGSLLVLNVRSRAEIDTFLAGEPFTQARLFRSQTVTRMRRGQWNPDAAPRTPEGD
jgi:uncharacterized protein YciI